MINRKRIQIIIIFSIMVLVLLTGCKSKEYAVASENIADTFPLKAKKQMENPQFAKSDGPYAVIHTTAGDITAVLYTTQAPKAVENFIDLAKSDYYNGSLFDYASKDVLVQGGIPIKGEESSSFEAPFEDEYSDELHHFQGALAMASSGMDQNLSQFYMIASKVIPENEELIPANMYMNELIRRETKAFNEKNKEEKQTEEQVKAFEVELNKKIQDIGTQGVPEADKKRYEPAIRHYMEQGGAFHLDYSHTVFGQVIKGQNIVDAMSQVQVDGERRPKVDMMITGIEILEHIK